MNASTDDRWDGERRTARPWRGTPRGWLRHQFRPIGLWGHFPGLSAIVDSDGFVPQSMDDKEGIGIADVTLDPRRKTSASQVCTGIGIAELSVGGSAGAAAVAAEYARAQKSYDTNPVRKAKALEISGGQSAAPK